VAGARAEGPGGEATRAARKACAEQTASKSTGKATKPETKRKQEHCGAPGAEAETSSKTTSTGRKAGGKAGAKTSGGAAEQRRLRETKRKSTSRVECRPTKENANIRCQKNKMNTKNLPRRRIYDETQKTTPQISKSTLGGSSCCAGVCVFVFFFLVYFLLVFGGVDISKKMFIFVLWVVVRAVGKSTFGFRRAHCGL
jgi:hypothetical protein